MKTFDKEIGKHFEDILKKTTKDVEWVKYKIDGEEKIYPFWRSVIAASGDTYTDFQEWADKQKASKLKDLTGVVKPPKAEFDNDTTTKPTIVNDYKSQIETNLEKLKEVPKAKDLKDMTGVVKAHSDFKTSKGKSEDSSNEVKIEKDEEKLKKTPKVKEFEDKTGVVKAKSEVKVNKVSDIKATKEEKSDKVLNDFVGVVKPKSDVTVNKVEEIKETKLKKDDLKDMSGAVKPQADFGGKSKPIFDQDFSEPMEPVILSDWNESLLDKFKKLKIKD